MKKKKLAGKSIDSCPNSNNAMLSNLGTGRC